MKSRSIIIFFSFSFFFPVANEFHRDDGVNRARPVSFECVTFILYTPCPVLLELTSFNSRFAKRFAKLVVLAPYKFLSFPPELVFKTECWIKFND